MAAHTTSREAPVAAKSKLVKKVLDHLLDTLGEPGAQALRQLRGMSEQRVFDLALKSAPALDLSPAQSDDIRRVRLLLEGMEAALVRARNQQAMAAARDRGRLIKESLVKKGELVPADKLADAMRISRQAVHKALTTGRVFAVKAGGRELYYPAFFADASLREAGLDEALAVLHDESDWGKWLFFTTPSGVLGGLTPIEAIRCGTKEKVLVAARGYRDR